MTLNRFLQEHSFVSLTRGTLMACREGLKLMSQSLDPLHNLAHIERILDNLDRFINESREVKWKKVNFDVLLLAICWHDIWKSQRLATSGKKLVYYHLAEGLGSMRFFSRNSHSWNISPQTVKKAKLAIRKHSALQFLPTRNLEAKILKDMDKLEEWSIDRIRLVLGQIEDFKHISPRILTVFKFYTQRWMVFFSNKSYFIWTRLQIINMRAEFVKFTRDTIVEIAKKTFTLK